MNSTAMPGVITPTSSPDTICAASAPGRWTRHTAVRTLLAVLAVCLPVALVLVIAAQITDKNLRMHWPPLLAAMLGVWGYRVYLRRVERRGAEELGTAGWTREAMTGALIGTVMFLVAFGLIAATADYQVAGTGTWNMLAKTMTEMIFIAIIEELVFRGILFRIPERALGTWSALGLSCALFALAHLPNHEVTVLAVVNTALAGVMFTAAYLATRRLWLPIGLHFAWNFVSAGILSLPTSGNPGRGLLQGQVTGPEWLTGGAYGIEGSVVTLVVFALASVLLLWRAHRAGQVRSSADVRRMAA
ncbi:CPBP family intramembrane glutamic endopeptidase [Duganella sp. FT27W]|uniref:CPBP family intramembrane glutamic endopeptidase n=1 Tax=Duganella sp. FT27W TaxID=2654636 RepID=UPI00128B216C|nr:CPBP family intramembrane glutamic endopeptidase [Duganella sp. FT27W]MPQ55942.1 CPBP family intramembrane metalloprotease [Duganella sp. FT27W]